MKDALESIFKYLVNPAVRLWKKLLSILAFMVCLWLLDGLVGFTDFLFITKKTEAIIQINSALKDSTMDILARHALYHELSRVVEKTSIREQAYNFFNTLSNALFSSSNKNHTINQQPKIDNSIRDVNWTDQIISSGFIWVYMGFLVLFGKKIMKPPHDGLGTRFAILSVFIVIGFVSGVLFYLLPPYSVSGYRYAANVGYQIVSIVTIFLATLFFSRKNHTA